MIPTRSTSSSNNIGKSTDSQGQLSKSTGSQSQLMTTESMSSLTGSTTTVETTAIDNFPEDPVEENNAKNSLLDLVAASKPSADWPTNLPSEVIESSPNSLVEGSFCARSAPGTVVHLTSSFKSSTQPTINSSMPPTINSSRSPTINSSRSPTINSTTEVYKNWVSPSVKSAARVHANDSPPAARSTDW